MSIQQHNCAKCGSSKSMALPLLSHGYGISVLSQIVRVLRKPNAWLNKKPFETRLVAWICGECGYTEMYAKDPQALWDAYCDAMRAENSSKMR
jgi:predicted nucleic-acid-binding Zn-ribbon protein